MSWPHLKVWGETGSTSVNAELEDDKQLELAKETKTQKVLYRAKVLYRVEGLYRVKVVCFYILLLKKRLSL